MLIKSIEHSFIIAPCNNGRVFPLTLIVSFLNAASKFSEPEAIFCNLLQALSLVLLFSNYMPYSSFLRLGEYFVEEFISFRRASMAILSAIPL